MRPPHRQSSVQVSVTILVHMPASRQLVHRRLRHKVVRTPVRFCGRVVTVIRRFHQRSLARRSLRRVHLNVRNPIQNRSCAPQLLRCLNNLRIVRFRSESTSRVSLVSNCHFRRPSRWLGLAESRMSSCQLTTIHHLKTSHPLQPSQVRQVPPSEVYHGEPNCPMAILSRVSAKRHLCPGLVCGEFVQLCQPVPVTKMCALSRPPPCESFCFGS